MKIGFIGLGNMSSAIIQGLYNSKNFDMNKIYVSTRNQEILHEKANLYHFHAVSNNQKLIDSVDIVILAVKPEDLRHLKLDFKDKRIVSMAAKTDITQLIRLFGEREIIRIMPNLNVAINQGTIAYTSYHSSSSFEASMLNLLQNLGKTYKIQEQQMSGFIALAGSSPALIYRFLNTLAQSAVDEGFSFSQALEIVSHTMIGSAQYLSQSKDSPLELIKKVASKKGTTQAGLDVLDQQHFDAILKEAALAIINKDKTK